MPPKKDLTGLQFGRLTVLCRYGSDDRHRATWLCECSCGNFKIVIGTHLTSKRTQSCGCLRAEKASEIKKKDLTGLKYGRLTVLCRYGGDKHKNVTWLCECSCCNFIVVTTNKLNTGNTRSCGCYNREKISERNKKDLTGLIFGRLTVLCEYGRTKKQQVTWLCKCDCGNFRIIDGYNLTCGDTTSCGCLKKEIASERMSQRTGENNPSWKGGISFEPYCHKFNNKLKDRIRGKYDNKCLICGKTEAENGRKLDVHHVDYDKGQGCNGKQVLMIPLCRSCHTKTNSNRNFWEYYCKYLIKWYGWKHGNEQNNEHMIKKLDKRKIK